MLKRLKVGDKVQVVSGKDKGRRGEIIEVDRKAKKVKIRGVCITTKAVKPKTAGQVGKLDKVETFINESKVMPICPKTDLPCRVRVVVAANGSKVRVSHRSGQEI